MDVEGSAWEFFFIDFALLSAGKFKFNRIGACEGMKYLWKIDVSGSLVWKLTRERSIVKYINFEVGENVFKILFV